MQVKKSGGKIYGAELTAAERKAMQMEIQRQFAEFNQNDTIELDAIVLWILHTQFGFGPKRLREFYESFVRGINELVARYELEESDKIWLCTHLLKEKGIDVKKWNDELEG